jgi:hypothetical protein
MGRFALSIQESMRPYSMRFPPVTIVFISVLSLLSFDVNAASPSFPTHVDVMGKRLELMGNGAYRKAFFFNVLYAALYAEMRPKVVPADLYEGSLQIELRYERSIDREALIAAADQVLKTHFSDEQIERHQASLDLINASYQSVNKGDTYTLCFVPTEGLFLSFNHAPVIQIKEDAFAVFYLHIWLGDARRMGILNAILPENQ